LQEHRRCSAVKTKLSRNNIPMNNKAQLGLKRLFLKFSSIERIIPFEEVTDSFAKTERGRTLSPRLKRKTENPPANK
jgi:hypothetical protein